MWRKPWLRPICRGGRRIGREWKMPDPRYPDMPDTARKPEAPAPEVEEGRVLFAQPVRFLLGVAAVSQLPAATLPEVAFAGRSNVGKSSLINALVGRKALARTSKTPGRTQELNFFDLGGRLMLVDLPGYGYAAAPRKKVAAWSGLVRDYLRGRPNLRQVCLLLDARHGAKTGDLEIMELLAGAAVPFLPVLTKADLLRREALATRLAEIAALARERRAALPEPLVTSARLSYGIAELRTKLAAIAGPPNRGG